MFRKPSLLCVAALFLVGDAVRTTPIDAAVLAADEPNGIRWTASPSQEASIDKVAIQTLYKEMELEPHHDLKGIVVVRDGKLISEHYFNGDSAATLHDIRSATKSITSLLMGIAIAKNIRSVNDPIAFYLHDLPHDKKEIRIQDLLTMRSGLDANDEDPSTPGNEDKLDDSTDWIKTAYAVPVVRPPGEMYLYCSLNAFLAGAIVENATGQSLDSFAKQNLFAPLGIHEFRWRHVPVNRTTGQGNLEITARDAAAIGELVLNNGIVGDHRVLSHDWIANSLASLVSISQSDSYADSYGYMWYTKAESIKGSKITVHFASGNGGNKIYIVPSLHMVVAITSSAYGKPWGQRRSQSILLRLLAAVN
ncbi:serine hydrolase domain-containing protein [Edaphobacter flagellatus]|uniref:serine hydrolase domain-containing protein n=1 Tax=Edaphobacter flagellatus TaxID=1933044 RepID=UPI0021B2F203|nr:serine hydrolase [Edaphobacter flagellatus]